MNMIRNILALIGLIAVLIAGYFAPTIMKYKTAFDGFDPKAWGVYKKMAEDLIRTGNAADATVWRAKVAEGLTFDDVDESIKATAIDRNIKGVGELPLGDQVTAMQGKPWRKLKIYMYCNPLTAAKMVDYSEAYAAYLPCRVALLEDKKKQLWIYTLNMDMMIYGGKTLPADLLKEALHVKDIMKDILKRASTGDF